MLLMQPQQPFPPQTPIPSSTPPGLEPVNPYEFFMNNQQPPKGRLPLMGGGLKQRIIIVAAGLTGLLIIAVIIISILGSGKKDNITELITIAQEQQEIIRVSKTVSTVSNDNNTKAIAATAIASLSSDQNDLKSYLAKKGHKLTPVQLALKKNAQIDSTLKSAALNNHFDQDYLPYMTNSFKSYQTDVKAAYAGANKAVQPTLHGAFASAGLLIEAAARATT